MAHKDRADVRDHVMQMMHAGTINRAWVGWDINTKVSFCLFLRSRGTRERILIWFRRREKSRFFGLQIGRPCRFLQGLWASFSCPSVTSCLLSFVASFVVFDFLGVSLKLTGF